MSTLKKIIRKVQSRYFPTLQDKEIQRWYSDDGWNKFRFCSNINEKSLVFDIGGFHGQWASDIFSMNQCRIIVFEPVKAYVDIIKSRFKQNSKISVYHLALGGLTRTELMQINDVSSSFIAKKRQSKMYESIQVVDISEWIKQEGINSIQLMKINIEGAEYELLDKLIESSLISIVDNLEIQFHNFEKGSNKKMTEIKNKMLKTHSLVYEYLFVWEKWTKIEEKTLDIKGG